MEKILVTGSAGFIGFHLSNLLLAEGYYVHGYDGMTHYYDVKLKQKRHQMLLAQSHFTATEGMLEDQAMLDQTFYQFQPDVVVHLAAQAGVRYSLENPRAYLDSNVIGTFNVMEAAHKLHVKHLLMASTSSVYGASSEMPFDESQKTDTQLTIYAATKKANESMAHAWADIYRIPTTMLRFFTVYGPWGRPDMALFKFTKGALEGTAIDVYNNGDMWRDFTYVTDLVRCIRLLIDATPQGEGSRVDGDSLSPVAPFRIVNIGNSQKVRLMDFIEVIEEEVGVHIKRNYMPMQTGDVPATWADTSLLQRLTGYSPETPIKEGVRKFIDWYRKHYNH